MPVIMVTEDAEAVAQYGSETEGVFVISFKVFPAGVCVCVCVHFLGSSHRALDPFGNIRKGK